jgi:GNAT superfamily N-acetyltransferase
VRTRRATPNDAALLARHRAAVWHEVGDWAWPDLEPQIAVWTDFFSTCVADETYVAFLAEREGTVIGSGAVLLQLTIPRPGFAAERSGRVQSVYVDPDARLQGVARAIMTEILTYARTAPLIALTLHPSDEARALYASLGFEAVDEMALRLSPQ